MLRMLVVSYWFQPIRIFHACGTEEVRSSILLSSTGTLRVPSSIGCAELASSDLILVEKPELFAQGLTTSPPPPTAARRTRILGPHSRRETRVAGAVGTFRARSSSFGACDGAELW